MKYAILRVHLGHAARGQAVEVDHDKEALMKKILKLRAAREPGDPVVFGIIPVEEGDAADPREFAE